MSKNANLRVLRRCEAVQMVADLNQAIDNVISMLAEASDTDKVLGAETLVLIHTKRSILESEMSWAERDAERDLATVQQRQGGAA